MGGHRKEFEYYSKHNRKSLKSIRKGTLCFHPFCCYIEKVKNGSKKTSLEVISI